MVKISKLAKNAIFWGSAFVAYRLYKLYELGNNIIYKPVGVSFKRGATINDFVIRVKMEILNPANTIVKLRGIDGQLRVGHDQLWRKSTQCAKAVAVGAGSIG